jgi:hypothetical protein
MRTTQRKIKRKLVQKADDRVRNSPTTTKVLYSIIVDELSCYYLSVVGLHYSVLVVVVVVNDINGLLGL